MGFLRKLFGGQTKTESTMEDSSTLLDGSRGNIIIDFQKTISKLIAWEELEDVEFGMWLPCERDPHFYNSLIAEKWTIIYNLTQKHWSYITADLLKTLKLIDENTSRIGLPDDFQAFAYLTTENEQVILSTSKEKGIRLHFADSTSFDYRCEYLDKFIEYCTAWQGLISLLNGKQDEDLGFLKWWEFTSETSKKVNQVQPLTGVGQIVK